jgi:CheY-like chemotaxis protein
MARILLVEDDFNVRLVMEHVLFDGGYQVDATETASGAQELLASRPYDLLKPVSPDELLRAVERALPTHIP